MDLISFVFRLKNIEITIQKIIQSGPGYGPTPPHPNPFHLWIPAFTRVLCKSFSLIQPEQKRTNNVFDIFTGILKIPASGIFWNFLKNCYKNIFLNMVLFLGQLEKVLRVMLVKRHAYWGLEITWHAQMAQAAPAVSTALDLSVLGTFSKRKIFFVKK